MAGRKRIYPIRTCISCGAKRRREDLVRLVLEGSGKVVVDHSKTAPGRGAYVCNNRSCRERLFEKGRLARAFKTSGISSFEGKACFR